jgi:hypothetical protein
MKFIKFFLIPILFALILFQGTSLSFAATVNKKVDNQKVDSFEMFWPISPGKLMGESLYPLKLFKEKLRAMVILSPQRKTEYYITISEKRLVEAEALYKKSDWVNAKGTLDNLISAWQKVQQTLSRVDAKDIKTIEETFTNSLDKQRLVLDNLILLVPETQKKELQDSIGKLELVHPKI